MGSPTFFSAVSGSKVNRESGIIEAVSVITEGEAKGHDMFIDATTLQQVKACAEQFKDGVKVKIDHGTGFSSIVGVLRNFRIEGDKLLADLHLLKAHEMRERLFEIAEEMPGSVGLSISFSYTSEKIGKKEYARCEDLYSVDFVDRPAANPSGLFRRVDSPPNGMAQESSVLDQIKSLLGMSPAPAPVNFEAKARELETQVTDLTAKVSDLAAAKAKITELEAAKAKSDADLKAATDKLATFDAEVAAKALQITSAQGQPAPIAATPETKPGELKANLTGLARVKANFEAALKK